MTPNPDDSSTRHLQDDEIRAVIDHYDDPEHPDALDVAEARALLADVQEAVEAEWDDLLADVREGGLEVVRDTGAVVVLQDTSRSRWDRLLDTVGRYDQVDRTIVRVVHHQATRRLLDRDVDGADPLVVRKPADGDAGQRFAEAVVNGLLREGVPADEAWAYYGVEVRGIPVREWADRCGVDDRVRVADAAETARDRLGR